ncbi:MAG: hypothetical protein HYX91_01630 [Chloroflexi bacterium]|nr:hypothetical protein [Chloroflexota bacterium]
MQTRNAYTWTGLSLLVTGGVTATSAFFLFHIVWVTAFGLSMVILGAIMLALGRTIPRLPPEVCSLLLETGIDNIAALVEELGIRTKAIYLPSSLTAGGRPQALIPLQAHPTPPSIKQALPQRLIVRYGDSPDDIGLMLSTVGSTAIGMLEAAPGPALPELETALNSLLAGTLGVADKVSLSQQDNRVTALIRNPRIERQAIWSHYSLGGPLTAIIATVTAEAWNRPVIAVNEEQRGAEYMIELETTP